MIIGIDVSKAKLDSLWLRDVTTGKVKSKVFRNNREGYQQLIRWAVTNTQMDITHIHFVMEATGVYHEGVAYDALRPIKRTAR
jgi:transposase